MRTLTTLSIAALGFAIPSIALAQDPAAPADEETDPAVQEALDSAKKDDGAAASNDDGDRGGSRLPVPWAKRPLTLTKMTLAPSFAFSVLHLDFGASATAMSIDAGAKFGITDDIEVEAVPLSFVFGDPNFQYGIGRIGGTYRFLKDDFEMGATASVNFGDGFWAISAGAPMRLHIGDKVRLDTGAHLYVGEDTLNPRGNDVVVGIAKPGATSFLPDAGIPVSVAYNFIDQFWAGARTGFGVASFGDFEDSIFMPLGVDVGATIPYSDGQGPMLDVGAGFGFPIFVNSLTGDGVNPEFWQLGVHARGYFFL